MPHRLAQRSRTIALVAVAGFASLAGCRGTIAAAPSNSKGELVVDAGPVVDAGIEPVVTKPTNPTTPAAVWLHTEPPVASSDWCISGVSALDEEACYVLPSEPTQTLLIYLHGIVPPTPESE